MTHEVRTPLNAVIGMTELLRQMALPAEAASLVETIHMSGEHLLGLVNDLLDSARLESGRLAFEDVDFVLRDVVEEAIEMAAATSRTKDLSVAAVIDPTLPDAVRGDPRRLGQVLANLLGNAVKFTSSGFVCLRVTRLSGAGDDVTCRVEVQDSGIGVDPDDVPRLFRPFEQADEATGRRYGGTGLGLSIAAGIVGAMGARIEVDSVPGQGSRFHFDLRLACGHRHDALALPPCEGLRVVLATRDALLAEAVRAQVGRLRAHVAVVESVEPLAVLAQTAPVALLLDPGVGEAERFHRAASRVALPVVELVPSRMTATPGTALHLRTPLRLSALAHVLTTLRPHDPRTGAHVATPLPRGDWHVLVVEDNDANCHLITRVLDSAGVRADVVTTGEDACRAVANRNYDLVLMDCRLPGMDGLAATRAIRAAHGHSLPIVGLTASAVAGVRQACLDAGMTDFLLKPTRPSILIDTLRRWLPGEPAGPPTAPTPESAVGADDALLDPAVVAELERLELFVDMARRVADEAPMRLHDLRAAVVGGDRQRLAGVAHGLTTLLGNVGWSSGSARASRLERACLLPGHAIPLGLAESLQRDVVAGLPRLQRQIERAAERAAACAG